MASKPDPNPKSSQQAEVEPSATASLDAVPPPIDPREAERVASAWLRREGYTVVPIPRRTDRHAIETPDFELRLKGRFAGAAEVKRCPALSGSSTVAAQRLTPVILKAERQLAGGNPQGKGDSVLIIVCDPQVRDAAIRGTRAALASPILLLKRLRIDSIAVLDVSSGRVVEIEPTSQR